MDSNIPKDANRLAEWFRVMREAKTAGRSGGYSVVRITVLCDQYGNPIQYNVKQAAKLSPLSKSDSMAKFLEAFSDEST